ncbi:MAG: hypothetical protein ACE5GV_00365 [Candidatus Scalindua sp.]
MTTLTSIASGSFTSDGAARNIILPKPIDYFQITNRSIWGSNPADLVVQSMWYRGYAAGQAKTISEAATGVMSATLIAAGGAGFTEIDQSSLAPGALVATGTAITAATPAVVSDATSPSVGDIVRIMNTTGMLQIAGMDFTVTAVTSGVDFTLGYLPAAGFAAPATNSDYRIIPAARYQPTRRYITAITAAASAVITLSVTHNYTVGDIIKVGVPAGYGMVEMDGLQGTVTAINTATNTITTNIDSSAFTAFAYPTSAVAAAGISFPEVTPVGELATHLDNPTDNQSIFGITLGTGVVGSNTDVMDWIAYSRNYTV